MTPTRLLTVTFAIALCWAAYWAVGAWTTKTAFVSWMEERREDGWQAEWSDITLRGFPNRFDRTIHDLTLADPETGWVWNAPYFQILGLSYNPNQLILVWPPEQHLQTPEQKMTLTGSELRASLTLAPGGDDALDNAALVFRDVGVVSDAGWRMSADAARIGIRKTAGRTDWVDLGIEAEGLVPPAQALAALSRADLVPQTMDRVSVDIALQLDGALDRQALETGRPQPRAVEIREIRAKWGELDLAIAGDLEVDDRGVPSGDILLKARNWREMIAVATQTGLLPEAIAKPLAQGVELLSGLAGSPKTLDIPLEFRSGRTWLGPVPIATAPRIHLP